MAGRIVFGLVIYTAMLFMWGCAATIPNGSKLSCPPIVTYSKQDDADIDREMSAAVGATWPNYVVDYGKLRAECRALKEN